MTNHGGRDCIPADNPRAKGARTFASRLVRCSWFFVRSSGFSPRLEFCSPAFASRLRSRRSGRERGHSLRGFAACPLFLVLCSLFTLPRATRRPTPRQHSSPLAPREEPWTSFTPRALCRLRAAPRPHQRHHYPSSLTCQVRSMPPSRHLASASPCLPVSKSASQPTSERPNPTRKRPHRPPSLSSNTPPFEVEETLL
jgi:hypothetical protein